MRVGIGLIFILGLLCGCERQRTEPVPGQGNSSAALPDSQSINKGDVRQGASRTATDLRPTGGSKAGAGGAGPGYDGSGHGTGKAGTIPSQNSGLSPALTNLQGTTNPPPQTQGNPR